MIHNALTFQYRFISTVKDLLEAEEAERIARLFRAPFRWMVILLGAVWLSVGMFTFDFSNLSWRPVVSLLLGVGIIYYFVAKPYLSRRKIRRNNALQQELVLEFYDDCIKIEAEDAGCFTRGWDELLTFIDTPKGIIFYFEDGAVSWLPERLFVAQEERQAFIEFLQEHQKLKGSQ